MKTGLWEEEERAVFSLAGCVGSDTVSRSERFFTMQQVDQDYVVFRSPISFEARAKLRSTAVLRSMGEWGDRSRIITGMR